MNKATLESIGTILFYKHPPEYRKIPSNVRKKNLEKLLILFKKWHSKEDTRIVGSYTPVFGTDWSLMVVWEFPDLDTILEFRRELMDEQGQNAVFKFLIGKTWKSVKEFEKADS